MSSLVLQRIQSAELLLNFNWKIKKSNWILNIQSVPLNGIGSRHPKIFCNGYMNEEYCFSFLLMSQVTSPVNGQVI